MKKLLKSTENWLYVGIDPEIRISRGLTQKELADLTLGEISVRTIQNYENGTTDIGAKNLLLLSEILETTPSTLLKVPVETFDNEYDKIHLYNDTGHMFRPIVNEPPYKFNHNLGNSRNIGYYILKEDSHLLGVPKGAKIIFDIEWDYKNLFTNGKKEFIGITLELGKNIRDFHLTKFIDAGHERRIHNYIFFDRYGLPLQIAQHDLEDVLFAVVKKVIIDF